MDAFVAHPLSGFSEHIVADGYKRATQTNKSTRQMAPLIQLGACFEEDDPTKRGLASSEAALNGDKIKYRLAR